VPLSRRLRVYTFACALPKGKVKLRALPGSCEAGSPPGHRLMRGRDRQHPWLLLSRPAPAFRAGCRVGSEVIFPEPAVSLRLQPACALEVTLSLPLRGRRFVEHGDQPAPDPDTHHAGPRTRSTSAATSAIPAGSPPQRLTRIPRNHRRSLRARRNTRRPKAGHPALVSIFQLSAHSTGFGRPTTAPRRRGRSEGSRVLLPRRSACRAPAPASFTFCRIAARFPVPQTPTPHPARKRRWGVPFLGETLALFHYTCSEQCACRRERPVAARLESVHSSRVGMKRIPLQPCTGPAPIPWTVVELGGPAPGRAG
jgi:hypothetical protein